MPPYSPAMYVFHIRSSCGWRQRRQPAVHPVADLRGDVERLRVAGELMRVEQAGQDLVQRVVRRPDALVAAVRGELLESHELASRDTRTEIPDGAGRRSAR